MTVKGILRRQRVYKLIIFLGFAGFIFLCFQIFTVQVLNQNSEGTDSIDRHKIKSKQKHLQLKDTFEKLLASKNGKKQHDENDCNTDECKLKYKNGPLKSDSENYKNNDIVPETLNKNIKRVNHKNAQYNHKTLNNKQHIVQQKDIVKEDNIEDNVLDKQQHYIHNNNDKLVKESINLMDIDLSMLPRGASVYDAQHYIIHSNKSNSATFVCIHSLEKIPLSAINDDYCDCKDSSDEPGTNACPDSKFYCSFQLAGTSDPKWIPGSRVNDGICDCCDGSDEWQHRKLPDRLLLNDGKEHYGVYQGPCQDRCHALKAKNQEYLQIQKQGAKLKEQYLQAAIGQINPDEHMYGSNGVFLMLSNECFSRSANKYEYVICPFKEVKQKDGREEKIIGKVPNWISKGGKDGYRLQMLNGESNQCPGLRSRMATFIFECGLQNQVLSIQETEVCEYTIHFTTPAVC